MTSVVLFSSPAVLMGVRFDTCVAWTRMPSKRRISPAARDEPDSILIAYRTTKVLSEKRYVWV